MTINQPHRGNYVVPGPPQFRHDTGGIVVHTAPTYTTRQKQAAGWSAGELQ